jgi:hypothetical protein
VKNHRVFPVNDVVKHVRELGAQHRNLHRMPLRDGWWVAEEKHVGSVFVQSDVGVHRVQAQLTKSFL